MSGMLDCRLCSNVKYERLYESNLRTVNLCHFSGSGQASAPPLDLRLFSRGIDLQHK